MVTTNTQQTEWKESPATKDSKSCPNALLIQKAISDREDPFKYLLEAGYYCFSQIDLISDDVCIFPQVNQHFYLCSLYLQLV